MIDKIDIDCETDITQQFDNCASLNDYIELFNELKEKYNDGLIFIDSGYSNYDINLKYKRLETDEEFDKRVSKLKKDQENKENSERKLLENLKRKYEK